MCLTAATQRQITLREFVGATEDKKPLLLPRQLQHRCHNRRFCCKLMRLHTGPFCQSPRLLSSSAAAHLQTRSPSVSRAGCCGTPSPLLKGYKGAHLQCFNQKIQNNKVLFWSPLAVEDDPWKQVLKSNRCVSPWCTGGSYWPSTQTSGLAACTAVPVRSNAFYKLSQ